MMNVQILADSINQFENRITTFQLTYPRFIHSQIMTHRVFSRNASSSRAIPTSKLIEAVDNHPVMPYSWGKNQKGMVADHELDDLAKTAAMAEWVAASKDAVYRARNLMALGAHKQIVNRVLEPFTVIRVVLTGTDFDNFFDLRLGHDAQPEIQHLARLMHKSMSESTPSELGYEDWHLPYASPHEYEDGDDVLITSVARCARVSYLTHDDNQTSVIDKDRELFRRLYEERHMSPFEHQAMALTGGFKYRNFTGWMHLRQIIEEGSYPSLVSFT